METDDGIHLAFDGIEAATPLEPGLAALDKFTALVLDTKDVPFHCAEGAQRDGLRVMAMKVIAYPAGIAAFLGELLDGGAGAAVFLPDGFECRRAFLAFPRLANGFPFEAFAHEGESLECFAEAGIGKAASGIESDGHGVFFRWCGVQREFSDKRGCHDARHTGRYNGIDLRKQEVLLSRH